MRLNNFSLSVERKRQTLAFTLVEVVMSIFIAALVFGGIITAYIQSTRRAEWSGYSLAAQALAIQQIEQARSAIYDPGQGVNQVTNLALIGWNGTNGYSWTNLDIPSNSSVGFTRATNYVTITPITPTTPTLWPAGASFQMIRVDTVWPLRLGGTLRFYTNTVCTYLAPDNRDPSSL